MTAAFPDARPANFRLRRYRSSDLDAVCKLDHLCFEAAFRFSRVAMRRFAAADNALSWIAETPAAELAGFVIVHLEDCALNRLERIGYVVTLDVRPSFARMGVATLLLSEVELDAFRAGATRMRLHVHTGNAGAISFYAAKGYRRVEGVAEFYGAGMDADLYERRLQFPIQEAIGR